MPIREIEAKSILRKHQKIDSWFISCYGMNLYRGCSHNCVYCDGRSESYYVEGEFGEDVTVKVNAIEILSRELDPQRKRIPLKRSFFVVGGGVGDSYQPLEKRYGLTRRALEVMYERNLPVHMLTKSTLIERDLDILKKINEQNRALVSFSFSSVDDDISAILEPGVPPPSRRLETLSLFKKAGIPCGMFLLPVVPFITDTPSLLEDAVRKASEVGLDFIISGGMTLKEGKQQDYFLDKVVRHYPEIAEKYRQIYTGSKWGEPRIDYASLLNARFISIARKYRMPVRIPSALYRDILSENDRVIVMLEQIDYLLKVRGEKSPYGYAAYSLSQLKETLADMKGELSKIRGINKTMEKIIREILETGTSADYEQLLKS